MPWASRFGLEQHMTLIYELIFLSPPFFIALDFCYEMGTSKLNDNYDVYSFVKKHLKPMTFKHCHLCRSKFYVRLQNIIKRRRFNI